MKSRYSEDFELFWDCTSCIYLYVKLNCWVRRFFFFFCLISWAPVQNQHHTSTKTNRLAMVHNWYPIGIPILSSELHEYVVDKKIQHSYDISFTVFCGHVRLFLNKICFGITQNNILNSAIPIFIKETLIDNSINLDFNLSWGIVVYSVVKSKFYMLFIFKNAWDFNVSKSSLEFLRIHIWFTPLTS